VSIESLTLDGSHSYFVEQAERKLRDGKTPSMNFTIEQSAYGRGRCATENAPGVFGVNCALAGAEVALLRSRGRVVGALPSKRRKT